MKRILRWILLALTALFFIACGGGGENSSSVATTTINGQAILGPLSGSIISIVDLNNTLIASYNAKSDNNDLNQAGTFSFTITDSKLPPVFLLVASDGTDIDSLDDGSMENPIDNNGSIHAIVTIDDVKANTIIINPLTEIIYQSALNTFGNALATVSKNDLKTYLDSQAKVYLTDANATYEDILKFNPRIDKSKSKIDWDKVLSLLVSGIHVGESLATINQRVESLKGWLKDEGIYIDENNVTITQLLDDPNGNRIITTISKADDNISVSTIDQIFTTQNGEIVTVFASKVNDKESYVRASVQKQGHKFSIEGKTSLLQGLSFDTESIATFTNSLVSITDSNATSVEITIAKELTARLSDHEVILKIDGREVSDDEIKVLNDDPVILWNYDLSNKVAEEYVSESFNLNGQNYNMIISPTGAVILEIDDSYYKEMMNIIDYSNGVSFQNIIDTAFTLLGVIGSDLASDAAGAIAVKLGEKVGAEAAGLIMSNALGWLSLAQDIQFIADGGVSKAAIRLGAAHCMVLLMGVGNEHIDDYIYENKRYSPIIFFKAPNTKPRTIYLNITEFQDPYLDRINSNPTNRVYFYKSRSKSYPICKIVPKYNKAYIIFPGPIAFKKEFKDYNMYDIYNNYLGTVVSRIVLEAQAGSYNGILEPDIQFKLCNARNVYTNFTYKINQNGIMSLEFDASSSISPDGQPLTYTWKNEIGEILGTGKTLSLSYTDLIINNDMTVITLETKSSNGLTGEMTKVIPIQQCKTDTANQNIIGSIDTPGWARSVVVSNDGTKSYIADRDSGLQIIDVTDPANPAIISSLDTPGLAFDVILSIDGTKAYVADGDNGLLIIDISDPVHPTTISSMDTPGSAFGVTLSKDGTKLYVADDTNGLQIVDITNPASPSIVGSIDTPGYARKSVLSSDETKLYLADREGGLHIIDISDPISPVLLSTVNVPYALDVTISNDDSKIFVADFNEGLQIIDISDPTNPTIIGSNNTLKGARGITLSLDGTKAYIADDTNGVQIVDIRDPMTPVTIGCIDTPGLAFRVRLSFDGTKAYIADDNSGLQIIDLSF